MNFTRKLVLFNVVLQKHVYIVDYIYASIES